MTDFRSSFMKTMQERGFIHQATDAALLDEACETSVVTAYIGFDCTADSLHVGSLVQIMMLRHFQQCGHRPIVLMGGGTTKIGDPSGRDDMRRVLDDADIERNKEGIRSVFGKFLTFGDGPSDAMMCDNDSWLSGLAYIPFLRDYGRHFSVNRMLSFDSVKLRLDREQPLSFLEFNYMILQAYDFLELARRHGCTLQMGGSDQWGNIVNGVELTRRTDRRSVFGLTTPLITTSSGAKMGKTATGAVWLNADRFSAYEFWQFWRNTDDADVGRFLRLFTELPLSEVRRLEALQGGEINDAKKVLADAVTALCHGSDAASEASATAYRTFEQGMTGGALPTVEVARSDLSAGLWVVDALRRTGLVESSGAGRRLIRNGGARVNDTAVRDESLKLHLDDLNAEGVVKLSSGRKRHALLRVA